MNAITELKQVHDYYQKSFLEEAQPKLERFLVKHHLDYEVIKQNLSLGIADRTLTNLLPSRTTSAGRKARHELQLMGVLKETGHEVLNGLILPLTDQHGRIVNLYSYSYQKRHAEHHFINHEGAMILKRGKQAILVDSPLDVIALSSIESDLTILYTKDGTPQQYLDGIDHIFILSERKDISISQTTVYLPTESFFEFLSIHRTIDIDALINVPQLPEIRNTELKQEGDFYSTSLDNRAYRVGGLARNTSYETLKVMLRVSHEESLHVDTIDLYKDSDRRKYIMRASEELDQTEEQIKNDLGTLLLALEQVQEERLTVVEESHDYQMTVKEKYEAIEFLKAPELILRIQQAYDQIGVVGESTNKIAAYLACASRKLNKPLSLIIQSTSAAGKSTLMDGVLSFFPEEETIQYSAMTGQSLYYFGQNGLKNKILSISEDEGAERINYALKILQSEGSLSIATTGKDSVTGRLQAQEYRVEGPVSIALTTTSIDIDEELLNRCLVLNVDESVAQTSKIHDQQRQDRTIEGIVASERNKQRQKLMQNIQRLIEPMCIVNPFAKDLEFDCSKTRTRRDHVKYLTLIETIALLHQHQRDSIVHTFGDQQIEVLPVVKEDIELADRIMGNLIKKNLDDLPPQTRSLFESIGGLIKKLGKATFTKRELRESTGWSQRQIRRHLERLLDLEHIAIERGQNGVLIAYKIITN